MCLWSMALKFRHLILRCKNWNPKEYDFKIYIHKLCNIMLFVYWSGVPNCKIMFEIEMEPILDDETAICLK